jgi:hypothetical protein
MNVESRLATTTSGLLALLRSVSSS